MYRASLRSKALSLLAIIAAISSPSVVAQPNMAPYTDVGELPDTPAGKRVTELIDVINSGDAARTRKFVTEVFAPSFRDTFPLEQHLDIFAQLYARSRGFDFHSVRIHEQQPRDENKVVAIVRNRLTGTWETFVVEVGPQPPHLITSLHFAPSRPPSDLPPPSELTETQLVDELRAYLDRLAKLDVFSGAVLLAKDDQVLLTYACGQASKRFDVPNRLDTKFNLGSMNKMFTGVAITQLVERGQLSFDDPLGKFLDEDWLPHEITDKVRIKHLLSHTSGLGGYFNDKFAKTARSTLRTIDDYKPLVKRESLEFEPGVSWRYSNTGFLLLGAVIEKVTGQSYFDFIRENVYQPAGMTNTECYDMDQPVPNLAIGYSLDPLAKPTGWTNNLFKHVIKGGPAGGGFSSVEDLFKFAQAMRHHKLLSPENTELVWTPKPELHSTEYGYGFVVVGTPDNRIVGHGGGFDGISANLGIHLDTGYTVAVLSNYDTIADTVDRKICELLERVSGDRDQSVTLPMDIDIGKPVVEVLINGQGPFRLFLDTGAGVTVVNSDLAKELKLPVVGQTDVGDPSESARINANLLKIDSIKIGSISLNDVSAVSWDRSMLYGGEGAPRGVLGFPLFRDHLLTLDYPKKEVRIASGMLPPADDQEIMGFELQRDIPVVKLTLDDMLVPVHIDSGSMGAITVSANLAEKLRFESEPQVVGQGRTVNSEFEIREAKLDGTAKLGRHTFDHPRIEINDRFPISVIGQRILEQFAVTFDQRNQRVRFARASQTPITTKPRYRVGVMMQPDGGAIRVERTIPNSPAEIAGLKPGDRVIAANGEPVTDYRTLGKFFGKPDPVTLTVKRDGRTIEIVVTPQPADN